MPGLRILLILWVGLMLVGAWLILRSRRGGEPMLTQERLLPRMKGSLDATDGSRRIDVSLGREIADLLEAGRRAEAVALVRGRTGWGAREADESVAKLERLMERLR